MRILTIMTLALSMLTACGQLDLSETAQESGGSCWLTLCRPVSCNVPIGGSLICWEDTWEDSNCNAICGGYCSSGPFGFGYPGCRSRCDGQPSPNWDFCMADCINNSRTPCHPGEDQFTGSDDDRSVAEQIVEASHLNAQAEP